MFYVFVLGSCFFYITYKLCGVRPTDILGIVQGMAPSKLVDNPIVCIASDKPLKNAPLVGPSMPLAVPAAQEQGPSSKDSSGSIYKKLDSSYLFGASGSFLTASNPSSGSVGASMPSSVVTLNAPPPTQGPSGPSGPVPSAGPSA
jgi:hypothetical protein